MFHRYTVKLNICAKTFASVVIILLSLDDIHYNIDQLSNAIVHNECQVS